MQKAYDDLGDASGAGPPTISSSFIKVSPIMKEVSMWAEERDK